MALLNPFLWIVALAVVLIGGEVARSVVDKQRVAQRGYGGTGDIAMTQAILSYLVIAMLFACLAYRRF